jgi:hypothetical protein
MKGDTRATCASKTPRGQHENAAFEAQALERWLGDDGGWDHVPDEGSLVDEVFSISSMQESQRQEDTKQVNRCTHIRKEENGYGRIRNKREE